MGRRQGVQGVRRWGVAAGCLLAIASCGTVPAVDGGPGGTGADGVGFAPPTSVPFVRPATAAFTERAEQIAATLRDSGALERYANGLVLLSDGVRWPDHAPTEDLKAVLGNGAYEAGPAVADVPGGGVIRFDDGRTIDVRLTGARSTLDVAKRGLPGCTGSDLACLEITSATLSTMKVSTNQGPAEVPTWEFSATGFLTPLVVVAVDPVSLPGLPEPVYDEPSWGSLSWADSLESVEGVTVSVKLLFGACERDRAAHVLEAPDVVVVGGSSVRLDGSCPGVGYIVPATIVLSEPLGRRPVVDVAWGRILVPGES